MLNQLEVLGRPGSFPTAKGTIEGFTLAEEAFRQAVLRGDCYVVGDGTGGQNPSGLSTAPISVCLANPANSGINAIIWFASMSSIVAPAAAQVVWLGINHNPVAAAVTGTAVIPENCLVGSAKRATVAATTTSTLPAAPTVALVVGAFSTGAVTVQMMVPVVGGWLNGAIVLAPSSAISFQVSTISGVAGNMASWLWEERPI